MPKNDSEFPRVTAGKNIVVETLPDGYRVSARPTPADAYRGYFLVRPYPSYSPENPNQTVQVVDGALPYEDSLTENAGYVSIDRLHWISEKNGGPGIGSRRFRIPVSCAASLSVPNGTNLVFLKITAQPGSNGECLKFQEAHNRTVFFEANYLVAAEVPELKEGVIYFPLAKVERGDASAFTVTQLNSGEPSGVIMSYYGSDTLDLSDSGSSESSGEGSSSSGSGGSDSGGSSASGDPPDESSSSGGTGSTSGGSGGTGSTSGSGGTGSTSGGTGSTSGSGGAGSTSGGGGTGGGTGSGSLASTSMIYDPDKWYIVADCARYFCDPSLGIENYTGTTNYYAAQGKAIGFGTAPSDPTPSNPLSEWDGVVMIEGPYNSRLDVPQSRITELNNLNLGDPC